METENHELAGLASLAAEADQSAAAVAAPGDPTAPELPAPGPDYANEAAGMVDMLGAMICGYSPACAPLWGADTKQRMALSVAPVMEKYGFSFGAMPCELTALVVCGPVLYQSARIIGAQMAEDKAKAGQAQQQAAARNAAGLPEPKAPDDAPAAAVHPQMALYKQ
jgi:hypothetical protein